MVLLSATTSAISLLASGPILLMLVGATMLLGPRNKGLRLVWLTVVVTWVYDEVLMGDDYDFSVVDLAITSGTALAISEVTS